MRTDLLNEFLHTLDNMFVELKKITSKNFNQLFKKNTLRNYLNEKTKL